MPGGGQNQYETMQEALVRECMEETGYKVKPIRLVGIHEEISINKDIRRVYPDYAHKIYFIFIAELESEQKHEITEIDFQMISSEWIDIEKVRELNLRPFVVRDNLQELFETDKTIYLGSERVN